VVVVVVVVVVVTAAVPPIWKEVEEGRKDKREGGRKEGIGGTKMKEGREEG
jgi:hypothetical protein